MRKLSREVLAKPGEPVQEKFWVPRKTNESVRKYYIYLQQVAAVKLHPRTSVLEKFSRNLIEESEASANFEIIHSALIIIKTLLLAAYTRRKSNNHLTWTG